VVGLSPTAGSCGEPRSAVRSQVKVYNSVKSPQNFCTRIAHPPTFGSACVHGITNGNSLAFVKYTFAAAVVCTEPCININVCTCALSMCEAELSRCSMRHLLLIRIERAWPPDQQKFTLHRVRVEFVMTTLSVPDKNPF